MAKVEINTAEAQPTNEDAIAELKEQGINKKLVQMQMVIEPLQLNLI